MRVVIQIKVVSEKEHYYHFAGITRDTRVRDGIKMMSRSLETDRDNFCWYKKLILKGKFR